MEVELNLQLTVISIFNTSLNAFKSGEIALQYFLQCHLRSHGINQVFWFFVYFISILICKTLRKIIIFIYIEILVNYWWWYDSSYGLLKMRRVLESYWESIKLIRFYFDNVNSHTVVLTYHTILHINQRRINLRKVFDMWESHAKTDVRERLITWRNKSFTVVG